MNLQPTPSATTKCPACVGIGQEVPVFRLVYCERECQPVAHEYLDATTHQGGEPHLHVTCTRCSYEYLAKVADPAKATAMRHGG